MSAPPVDLASVSTAALRAELASRVREGLGTVADDTHIDLEGGAAEETFVGRYYGVSFLESDDPPFALFRDKDRAEQYLESRQKADPEGDDYLGIDCGVMRVDVLGSLLNSIDDDPFEPLPPWPPPYTLRTCAEADDATGPTLAAERGAR